MTHRLLRLTLLALCVSASLLLVAAEPGADALVAHWTFDDVSGTNVPDNSGFGNTGTMKGLAQITTGFIGSGALDCGTRDGAWVDIASSTTVEGQPLEFNKNYTLMAWINQPDISGWRSIITKVKDSEDKQYWLAGGVLNGGWENGSGEGGLIGGNMIAGVWHHVAYTCTDSKLLRLYINGRLVEENQESHSLSKIDTSQIVRIGRMSYNKSFDFRGQIDDARIYRRALTAEEISALVGDRALLPPQADGLATATPESVRTGETVTFTAPPATDENPGDVLTYSWDFGDGSTGQGRTAEHQYAAAGLYTAVLTVTDQSGLYDRYNSVTVGVDQEVPSRLIAYWPFDGDLEDASGNEHDGTMQGGGGFTTGRYGEALQLNGNRQYVTAPNHADFDNILENFTIMAWIKASDGQGVNPGIFTKAFLKDHAQFSLELATENNSDVVLEEYGIATAAADNAWFRFFGGQVLRDTWHHVAVSAERFDRYQNRYRLFVDGKEVLDQTADRFKKVDMPIWIGRGVTKEQTCFKGCIDELRVYSYGMAASQVKVVMGEGPPSSDKRQLTLRVWSGESEMQTTAEGRVDEALIYGPTTASEHRMEYPVSSSVSIGFLDLESLVSGEKAWREQAFLPSHTPDRCR